MFIKGRGYLEGGREGGGHGYEFLCILHEVASMVGLLWVSVASYLCGNAWMQDYHWDKGVNKIKSSKTIRCEVKVSWFFNMTIRSIASLSFGCRPVPYENSSFVSTFARVMLQMSSRPKKMVGPAGLQVERLASSLTMIFTSSLTLCYLSKQPSWIQSPFIFYWLLVVMQI